MYELNIENMTCGHCVSRVTQAIKSVDSAAKIEVDLPRKYVRIASEYRLSDLTDAMAEAGYPAKSYTG